MPIMTLLTSNSYNANSGDNTSTRAYGTAISNAFANAGWVRVDTGTAIDWTTVVANGTVGVTIGSEVFRMNDALQTTAPVYIRLDYGCAVTTNRVAINFTIGHSTNGTMGLCGALTPNTQLLFSSPSLTAYWPWYFAGSNSHITLAMWVNSSFPYLLSIERTKDANGADTADGLYIIQNTAQQYWNILTGVTASENWGTFLAAGLSLRTGSGSAFNWSPVYLSNGRLLNPSLNCVLGSVNHFAANAVCTLTHYANSHNYAFLPSFATTNRGGVATGSVILGIRWE